MKTSRAFSAVVSTDRKRVYIAVPFDPDDAWGEKPQHHVTGTVDGKGVRAVIERFGNDRGIVLGSAWRRDCGVDAGDTVKVTLKPEGPQRGDLAPDLVAAFEAEPDAGAFFDSLAQFYRKAYLTWIDATKKRPDVRAERIAATIGLLKAGKKQRPGT